MTHSIKLSSVQFEKLWSQIIGERGIWWGIADIFEKLSKWLVALFVAMSGRVIHTIILIFTAMRKWLHFS